jgi:hypothetical protein
MKRWTVLFIPHDTDEPRSVAVSSRALRWMGAGVAIVAVAAIVGVGAIASWAARTGEGTMRARQATVGEVEGESRGGDGFAASDRTCPSTARSTRYGAPTRG